MTNKFTIDDLFMLKSGKAVTFSGDPRQMRPIKDEGVDLPEKKPPTPEELDHTPFRTGQYTGSTPSKVAEWNPHYIVALYENVNPKRCSRALYMDCKAEAATKRHDSSYDYDDELLHELGRYFDHGGW